MTQTTLSVDDTKGIIEALEAALQRPRRARNQGHLLRHPEPPDRGPRAQQARRRHPRRRREEQLQFQPPARDRLPRPGVPSYLIADGSELKPEWVQDARVVGITAGASAPEVLVEDVIEALRRLAPVEVSTLPGREETIEFRLPAELTSG